MSELELTRTLFVGGHQYKTDVTVHEVATDDDSGVAIILSQDAEEGSDAEPDLVALTWHEWAEISDHVNLARNYMPDGSETQSPYCGSSSQRGYLCIIERQQRHKNHCDSDGITWVNESYDPDPS